MGNNRKDESHGKKDSGQLMEKIFANLYNLMIPSSLDENEPSTKLLSILLPGITLDSAMDPTTYDGELLLRQLVDRIPAVSKNYVDSGKKVSQEYAKILSAVTPDDDPRAEKQRQLYENAQALLFADGEYTKEYKIYLEKQADYQKAQDAYLTACNKADSDKAEIRNLKAQAQVALQNWIASGRAKIDQALEILTQYRAFTPAAIFQNAIYEYELNQSPTGMTTQFAPATWCTDPDSLSWETVTVQEGATEDHVHKDISSLSSSFNAGFSLGLWKGSASGQYKKDLEHVQTESAVEQFGMQFKVARVDILREWFNGGLLNYPTVYIHGVAKNGICSGSLADTGNCSFPVLPTALILAKDINVYNNFSQAEMDYVNKASEWSAHAQVSYGPFSLGNDTKSSSVSEDEKKAGFDASGKIEIGKTPQIIGIISTVLSPAFPQTTEPAAQVLLQKPTNGPGETKASQLSEPIEKLTTQAINQTLGF